jgi:PKD repeat protein
MKNRVFIIGILLAVSLLAALPSVAGAEGISLTTVQSGQVSGGLWCDPGIVWNSTTPSGNTGEVVERTYALPDFESVTWARLYISEYCAATSGAQPTYAKIDFDGDGDGIYNDLADEYINSADMGIIPGSPHITRLSSNYVMWYDVTSLITADNPSVKVDTSGSFDGRLKFLTLVVAYQDGDEDQVFYWVNQGHFGGVGSTTFDGSGLPTSWDSADALNVFLASTDSSQYTLNGATLTPSDEQTLQYSGYNRFDVTQNISIGTNTFAWPGAGSYYRIPLALLSVSVAPPAEIDLEVTAISSNNGEIFAHEPNYINATIENSGADAAGTFSVLFECGDSEQTVSVPGLAAGASTMLSITDTTERTAEDLVSITVTADSGGVIAETSEGNNELPFEMTVKNNGYKGKRYTDGDDIATRDVITLHGGVLYSAGNSVYKSGSGGWTDYSASWVGSDLPVPAGASIREARLYIPYTWDKSDVMPGSVTLNFNGATVPYAAHYQDRKDWGSSDYPYGLMVYNVTTGFLSTGNAATLTKSSANEISFRGMILLVIYEDATVPERVVFLNDEMDLLYGGTSYSTTPEEATAYAPFTGASIAIDSIQSATLITFAPGAGPNEGDLLFNGQTWTDVWNYLGGTQIGVDSREVTSLVDAEGNGAGFQSNNDWMEASNAILIVEYESETIPADIDLTVSAITPNNGELFAHEANTITATVNNTGTDNTGPFSVLFDFGDSQHTIAVSSLAAGAGTTVSASDPADREAGDLVDITVTADSGGVIAETSEGNNEVILDKTVKNNGYKGKRYTDGDDIATRDVITLHGGVLYSAGNSVYKGGSGGWTEYSASWVGSDLPVPEGASVREARLYIPYTFDKSDILPAGVSLNFNGATIPYLAHYQDRKDWGSSNYPYGLMVYNVTTQFLGSGNSATLTKPSANEVSFRGMILVVIYENPSAPEQVIFLNEEMDMLYGGSSYSTTPEEATAHAPFTGASIAIDSIQSATLVTFAPGAGPNEGDLLFNGQTWTGVWNYLGGTQIGVDSREVTALVDTDGNEAGFQSNNDWMEASNAILVIEYEGQTPETVTLSLDPLSDAAPVGTTATYAIVMNHAPQGLAGYNISLAIDDPAIGEIVAYSLPSWAVLNSTSDTLGDSIWLSSIDLQTQVEAGATNVQFGTVTIRADQAGQTGLSLKYRKINADGGGNITPEVSPADFSAYVPLTADFTANPLTGIAPIAVSFTDLSTGDPLPTTWAWDFNGDGVVDSTDQNPVFTYQTGGTYTVNLTVSNAYSTSQKIREAYIFIRHNVIPLPGYTNPPTDPDDDNLYEDTNGNGYLDFDDVVAFYINMEWIEQNEPDPLAFDYNRNGYLDFDDVVVLYYEVLES